MAITRSSNCAAYTDTVSTLVTTRATVPGDETRCTVDLDPVFSCQRSAFETVDPATEKDILALAEKAMTDLGCDASRVSLTYETNLVGTRSVELSAAELVDSGKVSNCHRGDVDINDAVHKGVAKCFPQYDMTDTQGRRVRNTNMAVLSNLSVCDTSDAAMSQVHEDLRKVAAHNLKARGYEVDRAEDLACTFSILPQV